MRTWAAVQPGELVLIGLPAIRRVRHRPTLVIRFWHPAFREHRELALPDSGLPVDAVLELADADSENGRFLLVSIDPDRTAEARKIMTEHKASLRRWAAEESFRTGRTRRFA